MKKFLLAMLILILAAAGFIFWLFERAADGVPILLYHRVSDTDTNPTTLKVADFEAQLKYLVDNGYHVIAPDDLLDAWASGKTLPKNPIVLTFDDGHEDIYKNVFPLLQKYNMRATVFIVTDHIGMKDYLSWDFVRALQAGGFMDFESHTMTYKNLATLKGDKLWNEIYGSKQAIEWALKKPAKFIAYPEGKYTIDAEETSKEVGFRAGFIEDYGLAENDSDNYVLTRIPVLGSNSQTLLRFKLRLKGSPIFAPLHRFKTDIAEGNPEIADLIFIP
ncbi:MAG: polysaccharide deacetylase family protein [Selenomonadaceae bacterium]|nr:polysaccharide deacetylase family protein [Selenomonadaceae bacterium]